MVLNEQNLKKALELLFDSSAKRFDLVNMTRQYLANVFQDEVLEYSKAFDDEDPCSAKACSKAVSSKIFTG